MFNRESKRHHQILTKTVKHESYEKLKLWYYRCSLFLALIHIRIALRHLDNIIYDHKTNYE